MYVPKKPRRSDFCGCPPCPLCYDYVEPAPPVEVKVEEEAPVAETKPAEPVVINGIVRMGQAILGRPPTLEEMPALTRAAETIHEQNKLRVQDEQRALQAVKDADRENHIALMCGAVIKEKVRERSAPKPTPTLNTVNLDDMDPQKVKEACGLVAPVDQELLVRESPKQKSEKEKAREAILAGKYNYK